MAKGQDDLNRFLAEIDRLRKKPTAGASPPPPPPPKPKAIPVAKPVAPPPEKKRRRVEDPPVAVPVARPVVPAFEASPPPPPPSVATIRDIREVATAPDVVRVAEMGVAGAAQVQRRSVKATGIAALLQNRQSLAAAFALQQVLGPPRCRQPL
jgi:hypothetical protein